MVSSKANRLYTIDIGPTLHVAYIWFQTHFEIVISLINALQYRWELTVNHVLKLIKEPRLPVREASPVNSIVQFLYLRKLVQLRERQQTFCDIVYTVYAKSLPYVMLGGLQ
jgi:hypothetical protein